MNIESFLDEFRKKYYSEKEKFFSYNINLIDELHANENANSRIFARLLMYKKDFGHEILDSFLNKLCKRNESLGEKSSFKKGFNIKKPKITIEKERIDICIKDNDYAIIIENKFNNAKDQPNQLAKYIEKVKKGGVKEEKIFVIYMPGDKHEEPDENSWESEINGKKIIYKDSFKDRYLKLPFTTDIIKWLEEDVLPTIRVKDDLLYSALVQYIDYLKGNFGLRKNKMTMELQEIIKKYYRDKPEDIRELILQSKLVEESIHENRRQDWKNLISYNFEKYKNDITGSEFEDGNYTIGFPFKYEENTFLIYIKCWNYRTFACKLRSKEKISYPTDLKEKLKLLDGIEYSEEKEENDIFSIKIDTSFEDGYNVFKFLFEKIIDMPNVSPINSDKKGFSEDFK